jgi:hypothetical protein
MSEIVDLAHVIHVNNVTTFVITTTTTTTAITILVVCIFYSSRLFVFYFQVCSFRLYYFKF